MASLQRLRVQWSVFEGSPGVSTLYFTDAAAAQTALNLLLETVSTGVPNGVRMQQESSGDIIESTTGEISGVWIGSVKTAVVGIVTGGYAAPAGATIRWDTDSFLSGRRLRGRTYLVPLASAAFDAAGNLNTAYHDSLQTAASEYVVALAGNGKVWQRPRPATPSWTDVRGLTHPAVAARPGGFGSVARAFVPLDAAVLTSRRD